MQYINKINSFPPGGSEELYDIKSNSVNISNPSNINFGNAQSGAGIVFNSTCSGSADGVAMGKYNSPVSNGLAIGNGSSSSSRSNIVVLDNNGLIINGKRFGGLNVSNESWQDEFLRDGLIMWNNSNHTALDNGNVIGTYYGGKLNRISK